MEVNKIKTGASLDPQDWNALGELGRQMVDDMMAFLAGLSDKPVWQEMPPEIVNRLAVPVPEAGVGEQAAYESFKDIVLPYTIGSIHPRFWGWVMGSGVPVAVLADLLASALNPNVGGGNHAASYVEQQVLNWAAEMLGFPADASGLLVSGCSMANLVGLTVARNSKAEVDLRKEGLAAAPRRMVLYASAETHSSNKKAVEMLGLGSSALRLIPVDENYAVRLPELERAIAADREAGLLPFCIIGHAGTVNTAAFDDLDALADLAQREGMWFHVDGAFGALAALPEQTRHLVSGMERADSLAFDMHKWMYMPYEVGCVLVRSEEAHRHAFSEHPDYLAQHTRGITAGPRWQADYGIQLSRGFRALKVWMAIKAYGLAAFREVIYRNIQQTQYLDALVRDHAELELLAPSSLNIVCLRFNNGAVPEDRLNAFNEELLLRLHESGAAVPSYTMLKGRYAIRVCNTNHRTTTADLDLFVAELVRIAHAMLAE